MMKRFWKTTGIFILPTIILALGGSATKASSMVQNQEPTTHYRAMVSILPLYLTVNALRLDLDYSINRNHWIQAAPIFFLSDNTNNNNLLASHDFMQQRGAGLHLYHRYYPGEGFGYNNVYISYGAMWHYNNLTYNETISGRPVERFSAINKVGADLIMGLYFLAADWICLDFYTGMGLRYASFNSDAEKPLKFNDSHLEPGFSGTIFIIGMRIGFTFAPVK
jgi:hypothetical protein